MRLDGKLGCNDIGNIRHIEGSRVGPPDCAHVTSGAAEPRLEMRLGRSSLWSWADRWHAHKWLGDLKGWTSQLNHDWHWTKIGTYLKFGDLSFWLPVDPLRDVTCLAKAVLQSLATIEILRYCMYVDRLSKYIQICILYIYIYICVYFYICIHIYIYVYMCICVCVCTVL